MQHYNVKNLCSTNRDLVEQTFNVIYEKYAYLVFFVALEILQNKEDAKDITNETFLRMYEKRYTLKRNKNLKYYLVTIAKNLAINEQKKAARLLPYDDTLASSNDETVNDFDAYINEFSAFLTKDEVKLVVYRFLYEYSFKEIAALESKTVNSVSSKYTRTLLKIREHYGKEEK